jgi:hypothetical protein
MLTMHSALLVCFVECHDHEGALWLVCFNSRMQMTKDNDQMESRTYIEQHADAVA